MNARMCYVFLKEHLLRSEFSQEEYTFVENISIEIKHSFVIPSNWNIVS